MRVGSVLELSVSISLQTVLEDNIRGFLIRSSLISTKTIQMKKWSKTTQLLLQFRPIKLTTWKAQKLMNHLKVMQKNHFSIRVVRMKQKPNWRGLSLQIHLTKVWCQVQAADLQWQRRKEATVLNTKHVLFASQISRRAKRLELFLTVVTLSTTNA